MEATEKQLILVAIKGNHTQIVFGPATGGSVGGKKRELEKSGNWTGWYFQIRNYKKKELTFEQKLNKIKL